MKSSWSIASALVLVSCATFAACSSDDSVLELALSDSGVSDDATTQDGATPNHDAGDAQVTGADAATDSSVSDASDDAADAEDLDAGLDGDALDSSGVDDASDAALDSGFDSGVDSGFDAGSPTLAPDAPTAVTATSGDQQATLSWTAGSGNGHAIVSYQFFDAGTQIASCVVGSTCTTATSFIVTGLSNGTSYSFTVKETSDGATNNQSAASAPPASVTPATVPSTPVITSATPGAADVAVAWSTPSSNGAAIDSYQVEWLLASNNALVGNATSTVSPYTVSGITACNYSVSGSTGSASCTTSGRAYKFAVRAHNGAGYGSFSATVTATPKVSYASDNLSAIFNTYVNPGSAVTTCNGCHGTDSWNKTSAAAEGTGIYVCPAATTSAQCGGVTFMCGSGHTCIGTTSPEYDTLSLWIANGHLD